VKREIDRFITAIAKGVDTEAVHTALREREATLKRLEAVLAGTNGNHGRAFDWSCFSRRCAALSKTWRERLRGHPEQPQAVLRKMLPRKLAVTPTERGGWKLQGDVDYTETLREFGFTAVETMLRAMLTKTSLPAARW
jgi:hypothetical protein